MCRVRAKRRVVPIDQPATAAFARSGKLKVRVPQRIPRRDRLPGIPLGNPRQIGRGSMLAGDAHRLLDGAANGRVPVDPSAR